MRATSDIASTSSQSRRSQRVSNPPNRFTPGVDFVLLTDSGEPSCYKEAMLASDNSQWETAIKNEMSSIQKNGTWELVLLPKSKKALPCKWVYNIKHSSSDAKPTYKARLVSSNNMV